MCRQSVNIFELFFRSKEFEEPNLDVFVVEVAVKIEQMNLEHSLGGAGADRGPHTEIDYAATCLVVDLRFGRVNAVRGKLFAMRAQVRGREPDFFSEIVAMRHRAEDGVFATEHLSGFCKITFFHRPADRGTTDDRSVYFHRRNANYFEIGLGTEFFQKIEIPAAIFSERPFVANADLAQWF